jgi:DNA polymerase III alpha subunit
LIQKYDANLVSLSGYAQGYFSSMLLEGNDEFAKLGLDELVSFFGKEKLFMEVQNHGIDEQKSCYTND